VPRRFAVLQSRAWLLTILGTLIAVSLAAELTSYARPDIGFLLDAAGRVLDGAKLYVDVVEINPPLIVALNVPVVLLARELDVSSILVYRLGFAGMLLGCLALAAWYLRRVLPDEADRPLRQLLFALLAFVLFPLSAQDFGQREHLLLAVAMPYLLLSAGRALGRPIGAVPATAAGLLVGVGFALKPHFLLLFVAVEVYLLIVRRRSGSGPRHVPTPESLAIVLVLAGYGVAVLSLAPEYLRLVTLVAGAYGRFLYDPFFHLLVTGPGAPLLLVAMLAFVALRGRSRHSALWDLLAIGLLTCFLGGAAQQKGLRYHFYPSFALAVVLLGLVAGDVRTPLERGIQRAYRALAAGVVAVVVAVVVFQNADQIAHAGRDEASVRFKKLVDVVRAHGAGGRMFVMSYHIGSAYPLVNYSGVPSASRFPQLWILAASYLDNLKANRPLRYHTPDEMPPVERYVNWAVLDDFERYHPKVLLVLRHGRDLPVNGYRRIDYVGYFRRDPRMAHILDRYQHVADIEDYAIYERLVEGQARTGPPPLSVPGTQDIIRAD
jgi:hypothetical protein